VPIQSGDRTFVRLSFTGLSLPEPVRVLRRFRDTADELFHGQPSVCELLRPALRAWIDATLECVPVNLGDNPICVSRARGLSGSYG
jgi:hypothetical protein